MAGGKNSISYFRTLGLRGEAWEKDGGLVDVIETDQEWEIEAFRQPTYDQTGLRVIPLAYLVLMKLDSARGVDQGDLTRMLGRLEDGEVEAIAKIVGTPLARSTSRR